MNLFRGLIAFLLAAASAAGLAQPVRLVVSFPAGGPADMLARSLAADLTERFGRIVVVENLPGSSGNVATERLRNSDKTDGSELLYLGAGKAFPSLPDVSHLVPVAAVAGESSTGWWIGVFASPGTSANVAKELGQKVITGLNSTRVQFALGTNRPVTLAPGDGAQLSRLIASAAVNGNPTAAASILGEPRPNAATQTQHAGKTDPLSVYTLCVTAVYVELIGRFPNPIETMTHSRIACDVTRSVLERDVRRIAGSATPQVMLGMDVAILKALRAASQ